MLKKTVIAALTLGLCINHATASAEVRIGVSMSQFDDAWLTVLRQDLLNNAKDSAESVNLQFVDARADVNRQLDQVQDLVGKKVDAIIVNLVDTAATARITQSATAADIPLIYINRRPDEPKLPDGVATVTSDGVEAGRMQMQYLAEKLGGKGDIVMLLGDLANNATHNQTKGVQEALKAYPGIRVLEQQTGTWQRQRGMDITNDWITQGRQFNAVLAYNDEMGIGAAMALKQAGIAQGNVLVTGMDGTPDGLYAVKKGTLTVSLYQDANAQAFEAINVAIRMIKKEPVANREILIPYRLITPENVDSFK